MLKELTGIWSYTFMVRALVVGSLISVCAALLGVNLVLKRYSMIGDGLSHVGCGAMAIAVCIGWAPLWVAMPVVIVASFLLLGIRRNKRMQGDAAIGLISSGALAIGVMAVSVTKGINIDLNSYMFGSILSLSQSDLVLSILLSVFVLLGYILLFPRIFAVTFDDAFAAATGTKVELYNAAISVFTAVTIVLGMRMMGTLLISSLILFPALTSMRLGRRFRSVVIIAALVSLLCFWAGLLLSYLAGTPAGASVVCANMLAFAMAQIIRTMRNAAARH